MPGTLTYNFDPQQTVYVLTTCEAATGAIQPVPGSNVLISNFQFPGQPAVQVSPISGDILVREAVVQEIHASISESTTNVDAQITVDIIAGEVTNPTIVNAGFGYFPDAYSATVSITTTAGAITGVSIDDPGAGYTDGTGFEVNIIDPSLWSGGSVGRIGYDIVDGELTNASIVVPGTGYNDGVVPVGTAATQIPYPDEAPTFSLTTTNGGTTGNEADLLLEIQNGVVSNIIVLDEGDSYTDATGVLVTDIPPADAFAHELIYSVRLTGTKQVIHIEVPIGFDGVEQEGDIFETLTEAIDEYETRVT